MAKSLYDYYNDAIKQAQADTTIYDITDDTFYYVSSFYKSVNPQKANYNCASIFLCLQRVDENGQPSKPAEFIPKAIRLYTAVPDGRIYRYEDNFQFVTKTIKALGQMQSVGAFNLFVSNFSFRKHPDDKGHSRKGLMAFECNALAVDLDIYKSPRFKDMAIEDAISAIQTEQADIFKALNIDIIQSGRGLQLYLKLAKPIQYSKNNINEDNKESFDNEAKKQFILLSYALNLRFKEYYSDVQCRGDLSRIYRPCGACNLKNGNIINVHCVSRSNKKHRTSLKTLTNFLAPEIVMVSAEVEVKLKETEAKSPKTQKKAAPQKREPLSCTKTVAVDYTKVYEMEELAEEAAEFQRKYGQQGWKNLIVNRLDDLYSVIQQHNYAVTGFRNDIVFIFSTIVKSFVSDPQKLLEQSYTINELFSDPLTKAEVNDIVNNVIERNQQLTNRNIYSRLYEPMGANINSLAGCYTAEAQRDRESDSNKVRCKKYYAKHNGKKKKYSRQQKIDMVIEHPKMADTELAEMLSCDRTTILRIRQKLQAPESELNKNTNDSIEICIVPILASAPISIAFDDDEEPF